MDKDLPLFPNSDILFSVLKLWIRGAMQIFVSFLFVILILPFSNLSAEVVDIPARGTHTRLLVEGPENPKAVVALFAGSKGVINIQENGRHGMRGNFAVRTRGLLQDKDIVTVVVDAPADMQDDLRLHRNSADYVASLQVVLRYLKDRFKVPVWLHGTSRGAVSIAAIATKLSDTLEKPDGLVFSASLFRQAKRGFNVFVFDLEKISGPVLIMHHKKDACANTSPGDIGKFEAALKNASVTIKLYEGGKAKGGECRARHHHGFFKIEDEVIADMAAYILDQK
jgi:hypothetical protein